MNYNYKIQIELTESKLSKREFAVDRTYFKRKVTGIRQDHIEFFDNGIEITGSRSDKQGIFGCLSTPNSLFDTIKISIVTHYLLKGTKIDNPTINLEVDGNKNCRILENNFDYNLFKRELADVYKLNQKTFINFYKNDCPKEIQASMINYLYGLTDYDYKVNYFWKSFESISKFITKQQNEADFLNKIVDLINEDKISLDRLIQYVDDNSDVFTESTCIYTIKRILVNKLGSPFSKKNNQNDNTNFLQDFDRLLCKIYDDALISKIMEIINTELIEIKDKCTSKTTIGIRNKNHIERLLLIEEDKDKYKNDFMKTFANYKYPIINFIIYFIYTKRNTYFHGEEADPVLLFRGNKKAELNIKVNGFLKILIPELFDII